MAFKYGVLSRFCAVALLLFALSTEAKAPPEPAAPPKLELPAVPSSHNDDAQIEKYREMIYEKYPPHPGEIADPVTASTQAGSLRLTLSVAKTRVKKTESLWLSVTLTNVGRSTITISDPSFQWLKSLLHDGSVRLEFKDPDDGIVVRMPPNFGTRPAFCPEVPDPEYEARTLPRQLPPGASISTPADADVSGIEVSCMGRSRRSNIPPYGEISLLTWGVGKNRVRAHCIGGMRVGEKRINGRFPVESFDMKTDWITLEVRE